MLLTRFDSRLLLARTALRASNAATHGQPFFKSNEDLEYFQRMNSYYQTGKFNQKNFCPEPFQSFADRREVWSVYNKMIKTPNKPLVMKAPEWQFFAQVGVWVLMIVAGTIIAFTYNRFYPEHLRLKYKHRYGPMSNLSAEVTGVPPPHDDHHGHH